MRRAKKWLAVAVAMMMTAAMSMTVMAKGSPVAGGVVNTITSATDKNDNAVEVEIRKMPEKYKAVAEEIKSVDKVKEVLGADFVEGMEVVDVQDVVVVDQNGNVISSENIAFPLTLTFKVPGVLPSTKVAVLHYDTAKGAWESVPCKAGNGTIEATFNSLSPVAFVIDKNTAAGGAGADGKTSPKTGEGMMIPVVSTAAVVLLAGAYICLRKREVR